MLLADKLDEIGDPFAELIRLEYAMEFEGNKTTFAELDEKRVALQKDETYVGNVKYLYMVGAFTHWGYGIPNNKHKGKENVINVALYDLADKFGITYTKKQ